MKQVTWLAASLLLGMLAPSFDAPAAQPANEAAIVLPSRAGDGGSTYMVQPGDSLWRISSRMGISLSALMAANGITSDKIILQIGQVLRLPPGAAVAGAASDTSAAGGFGGTYTVKPGDSLYRIVGRQGVTLNALMAANGFTSDKIILQIGQVLVIPAGASGASDAGPVPLSLPAPASNATAGLNHLGTERVVIGDYVMWYDQGVFDGSKTWDVPADGAYNSGDYGVIQRQVAQAQQACLNGFAAHWYGPSESWTTGNFNLLLQASAGTNLHHALVIQANIWDGASEQSIAGAIRYALDNWAYGPNYLRLGGRPVLVFTDMARPWGNDTAALDG